MRISFDADILEDLYKKPFRELGKQQYSREVIIGYRKRIDALLNANDLSEISRFKGFNLEKLKSKEFKGCYSIRVNIQYRVIFRELKNGQIDILILDLSKHYE